jgi:hypothetical protein
MDEAQAGSRAVARPSRQVGGAVSTIPTGWVLLPAHGRRHCPPDHGWRWAVMGGACSLAAPGRVGPAAGEPKRAATPGPATSGPAPVFLLDRLLEEREGRMWIPSSLASHMGLGPGQRAEGRRAAGRALLPPPLYTARPGREGSARSPASPSPPPPPLPSPGRRALWSPHKHMLPVSLTIILA